MIISWMSYVLFELVFVVSRGIIVAHNKDAIAAKRNF